MDAPAARGRESERLSGGHSGRMLLALSLGWLAVQFGRQAVPPLLPTIIDRLGLTPFTAGIGLTLMWVCYAICHYPGGRLSDRLSRKTVLVSGLAVLAAGFVLLTRVRTYAAFLSAFVLIGVGSGLFFITTRAHLTDLFSRRRGSAFGVQSAAGNVGSVLGSAAAGAVLAVAVWRAAFLPVVVLVAAATVMVHCWGRERYVVARVPLETVATLRRVFGNRRQRRLIVAYSLFVLTYQGLASFLPAFLRRAKGFPPTLASAAFASVFAVGMVVMPVSGGLADRSDRLRIAVLALVVELGGLAGLVVARSVPAVIGSVLVLAAGLMAYPPVMQAYLMDQYPDETMGGDFGAFKTVYSGVGGLGPVAVGFVASVASYRVAFAGLPVVLFPCMVILWWLRARPPPDAVPS